MNLEKFKRVSRSNANVLKACLDSRTTDLSEIEFWEDGIKGKDLPFDQLLAKSYDILACCAIGIVPSIAKTGADGFIYFADSPDQYHEAETKLCAIESKNIHVGLRGGLYWSSDPSNFTNRASIFSYFSGKFDSTMSNETINSKSRYTFLVCFDRDQNSIIDAWCMAPTVILNEIQKRKNNATIQIKLSRFMQVGSNVGTRIEKLGWEKWKRHQAELAKQHSRFI